MLRINSWTSFTRSGLRLLVVGITAGWLKHLRESARGECKRLIINMPPRHTKSEFASYLLPAWFLGKFPHKKVIQTSHTAELAVGFG